MNIALIVLFIYLFHNEFNQNVLFLLKEFGYYEHL